MKKVAFIDIVKDQLGEMNTSKAKKHFHPEIIAFTLDQYYRDIVRTVYHYDQALLDRCVEKVPSRHIFYDSKSEFLFCQNPKLTINVSEITGGIFAVEKKSDSTVRFEPYSTSFEKRSWNDLDANFANVVRYWNESGVDTSIISSSAVIANDYSSIVWFSPPGDSQLQAGDNVHLWVLTSFYGRGAMQEVVVPNIPQISSNTILINQTITQILRKLGIDPKGFEYAPEKESE